MNYEPYFKDRYLQAAVEHAELVAFDMNGLIIDDERVQYDSVNRTLEHRGIRISESDWIDRCVGRRADEYFEAILRSEGIDNADAVAAQLVHEKNRTYRELVVEQINMLVRPGVRELIDYLRERRGVPLALCTSALPAEIDTILGAQGLQLMSHFSFTISGLDVERSKPHPETYNRLLELTKTKPAACLVFEDSGLGVRSAAGAGTVCIAVPNRYTENQDFEGARFVLDNLTRDAKQYARNIGQRRNL